MTRHFTGDTLVIATHNAGKMTELSALLGPFVPNLVSAATLNLPEPEETGEDFRDNAALKARAAATATGLPALADDSGLCVRALDGRPGLHTARWCGPERDSLKAMRRVHDELGDAQDRSAAFLCALALAWPDGHVETIEAQTTGTIVFPFRGEAGHGYDPCFQPEGETRTFAEMSAEEKNRLSHRGKALALLRALFAPA